MSDEQIAAAKAQADTHHAEATTASQVADAAAPELGAAAKALQDAEAAAAKAREELGVVQTRVSGLAQQAETALQRAAQSKAALIDAIHSHYSPAPVVAQAAPAVAVQQSAETAPAAQPAPAVAAS